LGLQFCNLLVVQGHAVRLPIAEAGGCTVA
jgi:hypothetical protein